MSHTEGTMDMSMNIDQENTVSLGHQNNLSLWDHMDAITDVNYPYGIDSLLASIDQRGEFGNVGS